MPANKPEEVDQLVGEAISKGDIEAAVALYEPDATFVPEPGQTVTGTAAIREVMTNFVAMKPNLQVEVPLVVSSGEVAILYSKWTLSGTDADGNPVDVSGQGQEVVRLQADGTWKFVIDNPWGAP
jgi:uncharacterized protein (TIGR02246 family)